MRPLLVCLNGRLLISHLPSAPAKVFVEAPKDVSATCLHLVASIAQIIQNAAEGAAVILHIEYNLSDAKFYNASESVDA